MQPNLTFLKKVLSIPTKSYNEKQMIKFIERWLIEHGIVYEIDGFNNIYVTKASPAQTTKIPCVVCHTDTVHRIEKFRIVEERRKDSDGEFKLALEGYDSEDYPVGIGGDDKCGIFVCLSLLEELSNLKAVFFACEEVGRLGSKKANASFFKDVHFVLGLDSPGKNIISESCNSLPLYNKKSIFFKQCVATFKEHNLNAIYTRAGVTDVYELRRMFKLECINLPVGFYNNHTRNEYVIVDDTFNSISLCRNIIGKLQIT